MIQTELLTLGRIKCLSKFYFDVHILQGAVGRVTIYDISDPYTNILKKMVDTGQSNENVPNIEDMFHIGDIVRCYVKSVDAKPSSVMGGRNSDQNGCIKLSVNPKDVNKHIPRKYIRSFSHFVGAVSSVEDHVYIIESGIPNIECILRKTNAFDNLSVGSLLTLRPLLDSSLDFISSEFSRVLEVTQVLSDFTSLVIPNLPAIHFRSFIPGLWLDAVIYQKVGSTITAKFQEYEISINRTHYTEVELHPNMNVIVCIIGVDPNTKQLMGSLLPHLLPSSMPNSSLDCNRVPVGTRFKDACVERVDKRTLNIGLPGFEGVHAVIHRAHIPSELGSVSLRTKFSIGQRIATRVIDHDLLTNVAIATMNKKMLNLPYLVIEELTPGDKIMAVVQRFTKAGIVVRVEERFNGLIPYLHLADVPMKRPEEKFSCGEQVSCCVLSVYPEDRKLLLSAKRSVVEAKKASLFGSNEMVALEKRTSRKRQLVDRSNLYYAVVVKVSEQGLLLSGLSDLRGWLPRRETGLADSDVLEQTFYRGQVLKVGVLRPLTQSDQPTNDSRGQRSKFLLSMKIDQPQQPEGSRKLKEKRSSFTVGQVFYAKVIKPLATGLTIDLYAPVTDAAGHLSSATLTSGFLSYNQLSDHLSNIELLKACLSRFKPGSVLRIAGVLDADQQEPPCRIVAVHKTNSSLLLSARPTLVKAAMMSGDQSTADSEEVRTGFVRDYVDLIVGTQWYAWVVGHAEYGVFVQFPSGVRGLAPMRFLADSRRREPSSDAKSLFPLGATVVAKVVELAPSEKRRCLVSLRLLDTYFARDDYLYMALHCVPRWLEERRWTIGRHYQQLSHFAIGDVVHFRVTQCNPPIVEGEVSRASDSSTESPRSWVPARARYENTEGVDCYPDSVHTGIVALVDPTGVDHQGCVEVVLSTWLVNAVRNRKENRASALQPGQRVASVVVGLVPGDLAVVAFRNHATGRFGVLPAKRSFNDVAGWNSIVLGQRNPVTLRKSFPQTGSNAPPLFLCTMTMHDPIEHTQPHKFSLDTTSSNAFDPKPGSQLNQLHFSRHVGDIVFFHTSSHSKLQTVFCRLVNLDNTIDGIRGFLANPLPADAVCERAATVIRSASQDKRKGGLSRMGFHACLPEISFLTNSDRPTAGDIVHAQVIAKRSDTWFLRLAGSWPGRLHVTGMGHSKRAQPITLDGQWSIINGSAHPKWPIGLLTKPQFIRCCVVDCMQATCHEEGRVDDGDASDTVAAKKTSAPAEDVYYVSTRPEVIRNGLEAWSRRKPVCGTRTEGFVTERSPYGLVIKITHEDKVLIPFTNALRNLLKKSRVRFRLEDHVCVLPERVIDSHLVGRMIFADNETDEQQSSDELSDAFSRLIADVTRRQKRQKADSSGTKRKSILKQARKRSRTESSDVERERKKLKVSVDDTNAPEEASDATDVPRKSSKLQMTSSLTDCASEEASWSISKPHLFDRYKEFMLPLADADNQPVGSVAQNEEEVQTAGEEENNTSAATFDKDSKASSEWRLRQTESHTAMLAALTREQNGISTGLVGEVVPETTEDFELAVRNAPDQVAYWTAYMSHVLASDPQNGLAGARAIAERGLAAIARCPITSDNDQEVQQARLLSFYLTLEAKELQRYAEQHELYATHDPVLTKEKDEQATRVSQILNRLVMLDKAPYTRRAINNLTEIGQHERAEELSRRLIKASPRDPDRWLTLIRVRLRSGNVAAAREAQRNALSVLRSVQQTKFLTSVARLEFEFGDGDRAISLFRDQMTAHPKQASVYEEYIKLLLTTGRLSEATSVKQQASKALKAPQMKIIAALFTKISTLNKRNATTDPAQHSDC